MNASTKPTGNKPTVVEEALAVLGSQGTAEAPLGARTTYRVGGTAAVGFVAQNLDDLVRVAKASRLTGLPVLVVGLGSNMLVADTGFAGIAVHLGDGFASIDWTGTESGASESGASESGSPESGGIVKAGAAVALPVLARQCAARSLGGLSWAVGVPGSVGGAVRMNAGGHGSDIASCILNATVFDLSTAEATEQTTEQLEPKQLEPEQLELGYRRSSIQPHQVVTAAEFACYPVDAEAAQRELKEIAAWRRQNQPGGQNAGSVFVNPTSQATPDESPTSKRGSAQSAGAIIDRLGLKGLRVGSACVSDVHANFIVADVDGKAAHVVELIDLVAQRVYESTGVRLSTEVRFVGFQDR